MRWLQVSHLNWFDILKGGTAVDAAIAVNAALGLMEPTGSGVGGDLLRLYGMLKRKNCMD
jgi:gamma-glutamyltranspeptidase/glutathione hydrolase